MKLVNIFIGLFVLLFTPVFVSAQSTAFGVDGSTFPIVNLVSFPVPAGAPITVIGPTAGGQGGDFGPGGVFYNAAAQNLLTYNLTTGEPTVAGTITGVDPAHQPLIGMAFDHSTDTMYATGHNAAPFDSELYTLDLTTAVATFVGTITNSNFVGALAVNCAGELYGIDLENDNLLSINPATAAGTIIGSLVDGKLTAGSYSVVWDGRDDRGRQATAGLYVARMRAGEFVQHRKMLLIK